MNSIQRELAAQKLIALSNEIHRGERGRGLSAAQRAEILSMIAVTIRILRSDTACPETGGIYQALISLE